MVSRQCFNFMQGLASAVVLVEHISLSLRVKTLILSINKVGTIGMDLHEMGAV